MGKAKKRKRNKKRSKKLSGNDKTESEKRNQNPVAEEVKQSEVKQEDNKSGASDSRSQVNVPKCSNPNEDIVLAVQELYSDYGQQLQLIRSYAEKGEPLQSLLELPQLQSMSKTFIEMHYSNHLFNLECQKNVVLVSTLHLAINCLAKLSYNHPLKPWH